MPFPESLEVRPIHTIIPFGNKGEYIRFEGQRSNYDCGQTCLDMLKQDGHKFFPKELSVKDVFEFMDIEKDKITILDGEDSQVAYDRPQLVLMRKDNNQMHKYHWVIKLRDLVICPSTGVMNAESYQKIHNFIPILAFEVPFGDSAQRTLLRTAA